MELGIHGVSSFATHTPNHTARLARLAEDLGYRSWWAGDQSTGRRSPTPTTRVPPG